VEWKLRRAREEKRQLKENLQRWQLKYSRHLGTMRRVLVARSKQVTRLIELVDGLASHDTTADGRHAAACSICEQLKEVLEHKEA